MKYVITAADDGNQARDNAADVEMSGLLSRVRVSQVGAPARSRDEDNDKKPATDAAEMRKTRAIACKRQTPLCWFNVGEASATIAQH